MRGLLVATAMLLALCAASYGIASQKGADSSVDHTGTSAQDSGAPNKSTPAINIQIETPSKDDGSAKNSTKQQGSVADVPAWIQALSAIVSLVFAAVLTVFNVRLWQETKRLAEGAETQTERFNDSITQATRSATAMEQVGEATRNNATLFQTILHKQMRAYLAVDIGQAIYQDKNLKFESDPILVNTGFTPARNVCYRVMADILPTNLPNNYKFEDYGERIVNDISIAPRQQVILHAVVRNRIPDAEVAGVMEGTVKRLYVWGTITYDDVFGGSWETNFCHSFFFFPGEKEIWRVKGFYYATHNKST